ncbi:MAG TPA: acetyl-CoA C-acyltransferase [Gammaproteobacteria bacterium]|nr:acetyl-CoA C-acyltransferase [Gammaproteobacteria bacterium]
MSQQRDIVFISGARTAIGTFGGSLKNIPVCDLASQVVTSVLERANMDPALIGHCVFGHVVNTEPRDLYLSRFAAVKAGIPVETPALNVNRLCGSGLQAIVSAAQAIRLGDCDVAVAGGAENMTRLGYWLPSARWGNKMGDVKLIDPLIGALNDPFDGCSMGVTAENLAVRDTISRKEQDKLALSSHQRAAKARDTGYFEEQIIPIEIGRRGKSRLFSADEHIRIETSLEALAAMAPVFKKGGTVTAGNAAGINDAAAAVILADAKTATKEGLTPIARLVDYAHAGVDPNYMGIGPVPAVRKVLQRSGLRIADMDVIELNEAFAAQALAVIRALDLPMDKTNPNGSGISMGHPIGATGTILVVKALYELQRIQGRYGLITLCIGGGQGIAAIIERL